MRTTPFDLPVVQAVKFELVVECPLSGVRRDIPGNHY
jgi:hypothetical protein